MLDVLLFALSTMSWKQRTRSKKKMARARSTNLLTASDNLAHQPAFVSMIQSVQAELGVCVSTLTRDPIQPPLPTLDTVTFIGGGFRTVSYMGWIENLLAQKHMDDKTTFYGASLGALWCLLAVLKTSPNPSDSGLADEIMNTMFAYIAQTHYNWASTWGDLHLHIRAALAPLQYDSPRPGRTPLPTTHFSFAGSCPMAGNGRFSSRCS